MKLFASIRDENPQRRKASSPNLYKQEYLNIICPLDRLGGGTWVGVNDEKQVIILLNGGFKKHERMTEYKMSRGLIVKELLSSIIPVVDWSIMNLENIEPFTLIVYSNKMLFQLIWDGKLKHKFHLDENQPHIFSSSTLYTQEQKQIRSRLFSEFLQRESTIDDIKLYHFFSEFSNKEYGFFMKRNKDIQSLSCSLIKMTSTEINFDYYDIQANKWYKQLLSTRTNDKFCIL
jgi:hypothetical protein